MQWRRVDWRRLGRYYTIHIISYLRGGPTSSCRFIATRHAYTARGVFGRPSDRPPRVFESRRHRRRDDRIRSLSRVRPTSAADRRRAGPLLESHKIYDNNMIYIRRPSITTTRLYYIIVYVKRRR